jgi:cation diffusion facilitator CzcD-associated flavoprotein CzcO
MNSASDGDGTLDVVVVGAGFLGVYAIYRYRRQGLRVLCIEAAADVGGVWYKNRYPGARCDVRSIDYSYSFSPELHEEWRWRDRYAGQAELLRYLGHVVDRFDLRRDILFNSRVTAAVWREHARRWIIMTDTGKRFVCRYFVLATGALSAPKTPNFPGAADFHGPCYQTSCWPHEVIDFSGKRVGFIGTGSSGVQAIPKIAEQAKALTVFQRTPAFSVPARNGPIDEAEYAAIRARYEAYRAKMKAGWSGQEDNTSGRKAAEYSNTERQAAFEAAWEKGGMTFFGTLTDTLTNQVANDFVAEFIRDKIRAIVRNPVTAEKLCPTDYPVAARRPCLDSGYFETYNRDSVVLVDLRTEPIERLIPEGIRTASQDYPCDAIVLAIGFDAFTGPIAAIDIRNSAGQNLSDCWKDGPRTYLGMTVAGFPNLFIVTGPGSPSVLANVIIAGEHDVEWIGDCIIWLDKHGYSRIEATADAQTRWVAHVAEVSEHTLYPKAKSWYTGANIAGKPRVFLPYIGGLGNFTRVCAETASSGYAGFAMQ